MFLPRDSDGDADRRPAPTSPHLGCRPALGAHRAIRDRSYQSWPENRKGDRFPLPSRRKDVKVTLNSNNCYCLLVGSSAGDVERGVRR